MKTLLEALEKNVEAEIEVQTGIQVLLDQQLEILMKGGTRKLPAVLACAEGGLEQSRVLERERGELLARIGERLGVAASKVSLKLLEERIGAEAATLSDRGAKLKATIERIRERNRQVGLLLRHSVLFIDELVRAATGAAGGTPTYTRAGEIRPNAVPTVAAEA